MRTSLIASAFVLLLSGPALAAEACAPLPAAPAVDASTPASVVQDYAAAVDAHMACLTRDMQARRAGMGDGEKAELAARMSRAAYAVRAVQAEHADAVRGAALAQATAKGGQVAQLGR